MWPRRPNAAHCAGVGEALAKMHLAGRDFPLSAKNPLSVAGWRPLFDLAAPRADSVQPGLRDFIARELDHLEATLADRSAARRDPRRSVSRQRVLPRRQAVGPDRLLFRLQRHAGLRRRDLPQRLVLRARSFLQRHQGARAAQRLWPRAQTVRGRAGRAAAAGARRGAALPADAAGRLAQRAAGRAGEAEGSAGICPQAALPPERQPACATTASTQPGCVA